MLTEVDEKGFCSIMSIYTMNKPLGGLLRSDIFFTEKTMVVCNVSIQSIIQRPSCQYPPSQRLGVNGSDAKELPINFLISLSSSLAKYKEMFQCSNCTSHLLRAVLADTQSSLPLSLRSAARSTRTHCRNLASAAEAVRPSQAASENAFLDRRRRELAARQERKNLEKEVAYLKDPIRLAARVKGLCQQGEAEKALGLVQLAGKSGNCSVSWNHIIDHEMHNSRPKSALKIFNDVRAPSCTLRAVKLTGYR